MRHMLFDFVASAFTRCAAAEIVKQSKHHPALDDSTGLEAAGKYRLRHPRGLRQLQRMLRIQAGERPLKDDVPGKRERSTAKRQALQSKGT